jgi:hypothetical protein
MKDLGKILVILLGLGLLSLSCSDKCQECTTGDNCPVLTKQCPGFKITGQVCRNGCCVTNADELTCTSFLQGQILHEEIIGDVALFEAVSPGERLLVLINGTENGWITAAMSSIEVRRVMESKIAEIKATARPAK